MFLRDIIEFISSLPVSPGASHSVSITSTPVSSTVTCTHICLTPSRCNLPCDYMHTYSAVLSALCTNGTEAKLGGLHQPNPSHLWCLCKSKGMHGDGRGLRGSPTCTPEKSHRGAQLWHFPNSSPHVLSPTSLLGKV